jgi:hypothetical protein
MNNIDILHFSYRIRGIYSKSSDTSMEARVNIVFKVLDDNDSFLKKRCQYESLEIQEIKTLSSIEDYQNYLNDLEKVDNICEWINENNTFDKVFKTSYKINDIPLLTYIPKFDIYRFHEWIDWTPSTRGIIKEIESLRSGDNWSSVTDGFQFLRCLRALDIFWS